MSSSNYSDAEAMGFSVGGKDTQKSKSHVINKLSTHQNLYLFISFYSIFEGTRHAINTDIIKCYKNSDVSLPKFQNQR